MSNKALASLKSWGKFVGYAAAALLLVHLEKTGDVLKIDWTEFGRQLLNFIVIGGVKAAMTAWKVKK